MVNTAKTTTEKPVAANAFSKEQIVRSKRFSGKQDLLEAVLNPDKKYTFDEVEKIVDNYMKGTVK